MIERPRRSASRRTSIRLRRNRVLEELRSRFRVARIEQRETSVIPVIRLTAGHRSGLRVRLVVSVRL
jgi:hypothetical protein